MMDRLYLPPSPPLFLSVPHSLHLPLTHSIPDPHPHPLPPSFSLLASLATSSLSLILSFILRFFQPWIHFLFFLLSVRHYLNLIFFPFNVSIASHWKSARAAKRWQSGWRPSTVARYQPWWTFCKRFQSAVSWILFLFSLSILSFVLCPWLDCTIFM